MTLAMNSLSAAGSLHRQASLYDYWQQRHCDQVLQRVDLVKLIAPCCLARGPSSA
jgi:hypothetical protein